MIFYKTLANGDRIPVESGGDSDNVQTIAAASTLRVEDSGKTFILSAAAGDEVALPDAGIGLTYRFIVGLAFATTDWTVLAPDSTIEGSVIVAGVHVPAVNEDTISFVATAESIGDWVEITSDGTSWFVNGSGVTTGSITLTQA